MALIKAAILSDLPPGQVSEIQVGDATYALCNVDGQLHCISGVCPHAGGPLGQGMLQGETLMCPWHGWEFSCRTGANDSDPDLIVDKFNVQITNGEIFIDVP